MLRTKGLLGFEGENPEMVAPIGHVWRIGVLILPYGNRLTRRDLDTELTILDMGKALEAYRSLVRNWDNTPGRAINLSRLDSIQSIKGPIIYSSNTDRKTYRGRILPDDPRLFLPSTKAMGIAIATTWPTWPSFATKVEEAIALGLHSPEHVRFLVEGDMLPRRFLQLIGD